MLEPGTVIMDKYRIERVLGRGGMGVVALARHLGLDQRVAIKFLSADMLEKPEVTERFRREAKAAVTLKTEHVCRIHDVGVLDTGIPYILMEYLDGMDLEGVLLRGGAIQPDKVVDLVLQVCEALAEAHSFGIVHRDLKPANLFVTRCVDGSPLVKVLDFGISKAPSVADISITATHTLMGTPAYMSPEQLRSSRNVGPSTDIWSLGVVIYELLSGRRPFGGVTFSQLCLQISIDPVPPLAIELPDGLAEVVARCLQKDSAQRFPGAAALAAALAPYASNPAEAARYVQRIARISSQAPSILDAGEDAGRTAVHPRRAQDGSGRAGQAAADKDFHDIPNLTGMSTMDQTWFDPAERSKQQAQIPPTMAAVGAHRGTPVPVQAAAGAAEPGPAVPRPAAEPGPAVPTRTDVLVPAPEPEDRHRRWLWAAATAALLATGGAVLLMLARDDRTRLQPRDPGAAGAPVMTSGHAPGNPGGVDGTAAAIVAPPAMAAGQHARAADAGAAGAQSPAGHANAAPEPRASDSHGSRHRSSRGADNSTSSGSSGNRDRTSGRSSGRARRSGGGTSPAIPAGETPAADEDEILRSRR